MNLIKKIKLNSRQKAIGVILIFPWYLYFAPIVINYFLKLYTVYIANDFSTNSFNAFFNLFIGIATAIPLIIVFKGFIKENWLVFKKDFLENVPLKRMACPDEIGELMSFLASDKSSYITGVAISIAGGKILF